MQREKLGSRLGFILLSAGCAIGIGNVWKFPYLAGENGGAVFVLFYLVFLALLGLPVLTMEFALGRASKISPVRMYHVLKPNDKKWRIHGYLALAGNYILMMFYTSVAGWIVQYFFYFALGKFDGINKSEISMVFDEMLSKPLTLILYTSAVIIIGFLVCSAGLQKGLERITKFMMVALLVIMVFLALNSIFLKGGQKGLEFYLLPSFERIADVGIINVLVAAMNQAFFTLSLGIGSMAIFGSYIDKSHSLLTEAVNVAALDTFVAITSGLIIFPACFANGVRPDAGKSLIFKTLPAIFNNIPFGRFLGSLFFVFLSFAALSTVFAVFENIVSSIMDISGWTRKKSCFINCIAMLILSLPCILGFNLFKNFMPFGNASSIMDLEDFLVSNIILPIGALVFIFFCVTKYGWGWDNFVKEANTGKGLKIPKWTRLYMTFVLPVIVGIIFIAGIFSKFI